MGHAEGSKGDEGCGSLGSLQLSNRCHGFSVVPAKLGHDGQPCCLAIAHQTHEPARRGQVGLVRPSAFRRFPISSDSGTVRAYPRLVMTQLPNSPLHRPGN